MQARDQTSIQFLADNIPETADGEWTHLFDLILDPMVNGGRPALDTGT